MESKYDPRLRDAAEELKAIFKKYDCAAVVLLVSPTHAEFINHITPSWSVAKIESAGSLRFRSKKEDFASVEDQKNATDATMHMLTSMIEWSRQVNTNMRQVVEQLAKHMKIMWRTWDEPDSVPGDKEN